MAGDKDAAKRRRQARNRQERSKRQERVDGARRSVSSRPARTADSVAATSTRRSKAKDGRVAAGASESAAGTARPASAGSGGLLGKLFPPRPQADADSGSGGRPSRSQPSQSVVVDVDDAGGLRGWLTARMAQPGGRATLLALFVSLVSAVTLLGFPVIPRLAFEYYGEEVVSASAGSASERTRLIDAFQDGDVIAAGSSRLLEVAPLAFALVFSLIPIAIAGLAASALTKPTRSRTLLISALAGAMYVFFSQGIGTFFILGVLALGFGAYQSRKADAATVADSAS